ncbi:NAD(P)H-dependent oxidoreductase [uncultured Litoreibacter sp.]|uniref:FMN-dependent NADH-azoreductase n=1 Tax=uncultured Litoreibacter sp. TaxID=1392394 RepID=UPI00261DEF65|nr:NAD(P)H-dependent oxidoreductase [uncultured Litoreibacter sp.]
MPTLLRIDSSARVAGSHTKRIADAAEAAWCNAHQDGVVVPRHIGTHPVPALTQDAVSGFFTAAADRTLAQRSAVKLSDILIAEVREADTLLLTAPIYYFSVPGTLKCWIDQVTRVGETFAFEGGDFRGLLREKRAVAICAYGGDGYLPGGAFAEANFLDPYLRFILKFIGIEDVRIVSVEATGGPQVAERVDTAISYATAAMTAESWSDAA